MAPGTDAVGLIHRQSHQLAAVEHVVQQLAGGLRLEPFRRQIEQAQAVVPEALQQASPLRQGESPMQASRWDAASLQLGHLVLHQGNQGRNHQHQALAYQRRQLITKRLAATGGQYGQTVLTCQQGLYHRALPRPKGRPTKMAPQGLLQQFRLGNGPTYSAPRP